MVDLDSNPTKLIEIVEIGKQLLITRGALTTFSIANDVAKYFAIIPAMFAGDVPAARRAEHHGPADAAVGDPVGGHLQRADHRRAGAAGAARHPLPADGRRGAAAPQPADLRRRRHHRRRSSASRSSTSSSRRFDAGVGAHVMNITRNLIVAVLMTIVTTVLLGRRLSAGDHRHRPGGVSRQGQRPADRAERQGRRLADHRPGLLVAGLLPLAAVGGRHGLRRGQFGGQQPRADQQEADRRRQGQRRGGAQGEPGRAGADRSRDIGVRLDPHISPAAADFQCPRSPASAA